MRRVIGLGFALGGVALACLLVGMGNGSDCATGMSSAACLGGSLGGVRTWLGFGGAAAATAIGDSRQAFVNWLDPSAWPIIRSAS